jgi:hypothetical protein
MLQLNKLARLSKVAVAGLSLASAPLEAAQNQPAHKLDLSEANFSSTDPLNNSNTNYRSEALNTFMAFSAFITAIGGVFYTLNALADYQNKSVQDQEALRRRRHDPRES